MIDELVEMLPGESVYEKVLLAERILDRLRPRWKVKTEFPELLSEDPVVIELREILMRRFGSGRGEGSTLMWDVIAQVSKEYFDLMGDNHELS